MCSAWCWDCTFRCRNGTSAELKNSPEFIETRKRWSRDRNPYHSDSQPMLLNPIPKFNRYDGVLFVSFEHLLF